jgi:hypothetical protein
VRKINSCAENSAKHEEVQKFKNSGIPEGVFRRRGLVNHKSGKRALREKPKKEGVIQKRKTQQACENVEISIIS